MRYRFSLTLFVIFMPFCRLDAQALVGLLGRSDSLQIRGNHYFSEPSIIGALMRSPDFLIAAHPKASRAAFLETTERLIQAGYLVQGHPEAKVVATLCEDEQKVRGIIIAKDISNDLRLACSVTQDITLKEYSITFSLDKVS